MNFRQFLEMNVPGVHNDGPGGGFANNSGGAYLTSDQTGSESGLYGKSQPLLPSYDLTAQLLPTVTKTGRVTKYDPNSQEKGSAITLRMQTDDHKAENIALSRDQWDTMKKMNGGREPGIGQRITVTFQRKKGDRRQNIWDGSPNASPILGISY
jgi:hypothetical protein